MSASGASTPRETAGLLLVDKPRGPTSHDVVQWVRRRLGERRVGHTGTLDPFASGLLVLCLGRATRLAEYLTGLDKAYDATVRLGVRTATHDPEGEIVEESGAWRDLDREDVERALAGLGGRILQRPPSFSAKKVGGLAAHRLARSGSPPRLAPVEVTVHRLELAHAALPELRLTVECSSGTYVRALARDLGEALGVGAHLTALRRTRVGSFHVTDAVPISEGVEPDVLRNALLGPEHAVAHLPRITVDEAGVELVAHGRPLPLEMAVPGDGPVAVLGKGGLVAVGTREGNRLRPRKVFVSRSGA